MLGWGHEPHFEDCRDALIDLLEDEQMDARLDDDRTCPIDDGTCPIAVEDSREKLEADVYRAADEMEKFTYGEKFINTNKILRWLDRQEAITEREHPGLTISDDESLINWHGKNYLLQSRVLNAERERDEFSLKLKHEMELNRDNRSAHDLERIQELEHERDKAEARVAELESTISALKELLLEVPVDSIAASKLEGGL
jgi:hypothetical protein